MPSLSNTRKKLEKCRKSPRKSRGASFRPAVRGRHGRRSRRPSIGAATAAGIGRTSEDARIDVLEALGRADDAQAARWGCFERSLSSTHLRAYLKRLADFDDLQAEEKALDHAQRSRNSLRALSFLVSWPAVDRAANLVLQRSEELDGNHYEILTPAAEALAGKHPLAAMLVLRAMVDFSLRNNRSGRYRHAARHLLECSSLASAIEDFGRFEPHDAYEARLRREHGRKSSFWNLID